jgi:predicted PurR-regulated permease PerM
MRRSRLAFVLIAIAALPLAVPSVRPGLLMIALSALYAFVTWPLARVLTRRLPRWLAIGVANLALAVAFILAVTLGGPFFVSQIRALLTEVPSAFALAVHDLPFATRDAVLNLLKPENGAAISVWKEMLSAGYGAARSVAGVAAAAVVVPVLAAYFQYDAPRYTRALTQLVPSQRQAALHELLRQVSDTFQSYVRAQALISFIVGLLVYVVLSIAGIPFAAAIAVLTACADLVPYVGGIAAFVPASLLALAFGGIWRLVLVTILIVAVFEFEAQVLQPQIVGSRTHLPPSIVVVSLILGGALFGILGLYLAVPLAATIPLIWKFSEEAPAR